MANNGPDVEGEKQKKPEEHRGLSPFIVLGITFFIIGLSQGNYAFIAIGIIFAMLGMNGVLKARKQKIDSDHSDSDEKED